MPIPNIDVSLYPGLRKNSVTPPRISTRAGLVDGTRGSDPAPQGVIFQESFDDQPDFLGSVNGSDSAYYASDGAIVPVGWDAIRHDPTWSPSRGHSDRHEAIEILASNSNKARGGVGKCYVSWRDYYDPGWNRWNSDSIISKYFPGGFNQLYVEFYVAFGPNWTPTGTSKLFRISSWDEVGDYFGFGGGRNNGPVMIWDYEHSSYGVRNRFSFRGGPHGENYGFNNDDIPDFNRQLNGSGDASMSFMNNFNDPIGDNQNPPFILNKSTGSGSITQLGRDPVHEELYGPPGTYTKYAFFVKMNSAPGLLDGQLMQWIDDELVINCPAVRWNKENTGSIHPKWNRVDFGGNDYWRSSLYTNEDRREEWYAIDDIVIRDSIPEEIL